MGWAGGRGRPCGAGEGPGQGHSQAPVQGSQGLRPWQGQTGRQSPRPRGRGRGLREHSLPLQGKRKMSFSAAKLLYHKNCFDFTPQWALKRRPRNNCSQINQNEKVMLNPTASQCGRHSIKRVQNGFWSQKVLKKAMPYFETVFFLLFEQLNHAPSLGKVSFTKIV